MSICSGFLVHFLRKEYGTFQLYSGQDKSSTQVKKLVKKLVNFF